MIYTKPIMLTEPTMCLNLKRSPYLKTETKDFYKSLAFCNQIYNQTEFKFSKIHSKKTHFKIWIDRSILILKEYDSFCILNSDYQAMGYFAILHKKNTAKIAILD